MLCYNSTKNINLMMFSKERSETGERLKGRIQIRKAAVGRIQVFGHGRIKG